MRALAWSVLTWIASSFTAVGSLVLARMAYRHRAKRKPVAVGTPEVDELMVIADAVADNPDNEHWRLWEAELAKGAQS